ncbi:unnamed protein product [Paramecium octaurelia]|uniref:SURF1-like protein n=1 Tax=Paramecium octaurelia TaxID=43137 RepID=A0A8S1SNE2_PAROT|nr:unnamed protein product [Paramecium octaurelia]
MALALKQLCGFSRVNAQCPTYKYICAGLSGGSLLYAFYAQVQKQWRESEIQFRKEQLKKPIYELREEELVSPPWNSSNLNEWLYRRVRVTGRPLHYLQMMVPRTEFQKPGYECVVPFVTKENADQTVQEGLLVSLGFVPYEYKEVPDRHKLEDSSVQSFDCFLSQLPELQDNSFGNVANRRNSEWTYADLQLMGQFTGFKNADKIGKVVLERANFNTPLDERNMRTYDLDADHHLDYPYLKSNSGILYHKNHMPWDWQRAKQQALGSTVLFGALGALLHLAK